MWLQHLKLQAIRIVIFVFVGNSAENNAIQMFKFCIITFASAFQRLLFKYIYHFRVLKYKQYFLGHHNKYLSEQGKNHIMNYPEK